MADLIRTPIAATYPLDQVQDAFRELEKRHTRGKIVLKPGPAPSERTHRPPPRDSAGRPGEGI
ncbi:zinc-binding dehydrogenase [Nonomuraea sp. NPDC052116]|uniref:zinc-binding dehydrogenase n=1 Tax=Nonomuraea sp. NPDC052116 TaxID=3155665 RepID=UPI00342AF829